MNPADMIRDTAFADDAESVAWAAQIKKATDDWHALKNQLAALVNGAHGSGTWSKGYHLAHIEDAEHHVLSILEDV